MQDLGLDLNDVLKWLVLMQHRLNFNIGSYASLAVQDLLSPGHGH